MSRTVSGNEFQIEGQEVAKLRDPYRANRHNAALIIYLYLEFGICLLCSPPSKKLSLCIVGYTPSVRPSVCLSDPWLSITQE